MDKTITLEFPEKKLEALSHFLKKNRHHHRSRAGLRPGPAVRKDRTAHRPGIPGGHRIGRRFTSEFLNITYKDVQRYGREKSGADLRRRSR